MRFNLLKAVGNYDILFSTNVLNILSLCVKMDPQGGNKIKERRQSQIEMFYTFIVCEVKWYQVFVVPHYIVW